MTTMSSAIAKMYDIRTLARIVWCLHDYWGNEANMATSLAAKIEDQSTEVLDFLNSIEFLPAIRALDDPPVQADGNIVPFKVFHHGKKA